MTTPAPAVLWERWRRRRESGAFAALVRPHLPHAIAVARRYGCDAGAAEDVVQETLLELAREASDDPVRVGVRPWLARRVGFRARKSVRASGRRRRHEQAASGPSAGAGASLDVRDEVEAALALLRPAERQAVVLRYLHDLDYQEIAYVLGTSKNACQIRVHRGIDKLRRSLGRHPAALVAALGLPAVPAEAALIQASITGAATAAASAGGGIVIMSTGMKLAGAAVLGAAVTAVGMLAITTTTTTTRTGGSERRTAEREEPTRRDRTGPAVPVADLDITEADLPWVRELIERERARRDDARIRPDDSGLDILARVLRSEADVSDLVRDFDRFARHVQSATGRVARIESTGDVTKVDPDALPGDAAVIEFGPGTFRIDRNSRDFHLRRNDLRELEIRGAGMNRTTLIAASVDFLTPLGQLEHLRIHDLTFDGGERGSAMLDIRGKVAVIFENVRFRSWSSGGYSAPVGLSGGAYLGARNCEWINGHRGLTGLAAIAIRGTAVATFADCLFADLTGVLMGGSGAARRSVVHLESCVFENSRLADSRMRYQGKPEFLVTVRGGRVHFESRAAWGATYAAEIDGVTFVEPIPRCRLSDLLRVVRGLRLEEGQRLKGVQLVAPTREPATEFLVYVENSREFVERLRQEKRRARDRFVVTLEGDRVQVQPEDRSRRLPNYHRGQILPGSRDLLDVVGRAALDPALEVYGIVSSRFSTTDGAIPAVELRNRNGRPEIVLDGVTGERLK